MASAQDATLRQQIRQARGKFIAMATAYSLGVFNDSFFRNSVIMLAVAAAKPGFSGLVMLLFALPYLLVAAPAGWLADRFPKRRIVIGAKGLEVVAMACGAIGIWTNFWPLMLAMAFLMGMQSAFFSPSLNGSIPELYPASYVTAANAKLKVATTGAILLGIAVAAATLGLEEVAFGDTSVGQVVVGVGVLVVALLGLAASFGVPRRKAADPNARFPWTGPVDTVFELLRIRKDRLLATTISCSVFMFSVGTALIIVIYELGEHQYGLTKPMTGGLVFVESCGVAVGGLLSSRLARGKRWYRVLSPCALGMGLAMLGVWGATLLPGSWQLPIIFPLLGIAGLFGGLMLVPCEAFIQVRPVPERKGAVIAAANFAVFTGIMLSGLAAEGLLHLLNLAPTTCFAPVGALALLMAGVLAVALPAGPGNALDTLLAALTRLLLSLRYRVEVRGLDEVARRGTRSILFLPNHPALIDPPIMISLLFWKFAPRAWADQDQIDRFLIRRLAPRFGVRPVPGVSSYGEGSRAQVQEALGAFADDLRSGRCVLLYPSGHVYRSHLEDLRGNTAACTILQQIPEVRVVLVRTRGLWGSRFSWAGGQAPDVGKTLKRGLVSLLLSGVLFGPRRRVTMEFFEPQDLPPAADCDALNRYMEEFYNRDAPPNTYVPYTAWEKGGERQMPEPFIGARSEDVGRVPKATRQIVIGHLREMTGVSDLPDEAHLARDLGLDSLSRVELMAWLEQEFGFPQGNVETLQTVADVLLGACGETVAGEPAELKEVPARWFARRWRGESLRVARGDTISEAFLNAARRAPGQAIIADQRAGVKTYRDVITAILVLRGEVESLPGERVGVMLPASVAATVTYLSVMFAGRVPVMVNWTGGPRNVLHSLDLVGVKRIVTARALVSRIARQGNDLSALSDRFVFLEDLAQGVSRGRKLAAWLRARLSWRSLAVVRVSEMAVILFTSGSESLPKAVPLTHANLLTNARDVCKLGVLRDGDCLIGILPPFHSFGLGVTVITALCTGMPTVYHPVPMEAGMLARLIESYKVSVLVGTPTFLNGIARASTSRQLATLRVAVTGAEKCPDRTYDALAERCPQMAVLEGYGVTECSPIISVNDPKAPRRGTIGKVVPSVQYAMVDVDTGRRAARGARGMLLVRGPSIFGGYLGHDGQSPFVEFEGKAWYSTGDLVVEDESGVLTFCGRLKRFAKLGGEMISLPAVEAVLADHYPSGDDEGPLLAVEASDDAEHPEIVLFAAVEIDRQTANRHIREAGLSPLHNIRRIIRLDEIPLLGTGKTDYRRLRQMLAGSAPRSGA